MIRKESITEYNVHLFIRGEYYNFPECCIQEFADQFDLEYEELEKAREGFKSHIAYGTGYVPCKKCREATKDLSEEELEALLGIKLFVPTPTGEEYTQSHNEMLNDPKYREIESRYLDLVFDNSLRSSESFQEIVERLNLDLPNYLIEQGVGLNYMTNGYNEVVEYLGNHKISEEDIDWDIPLLPQVLDSIRNMAKTLTEFSILLDDKWGVDND